MTKQGNVQNKLLTLAIVFCCTGRSADVPLKNCEVVKVPQQWRIMDMDLMDRKPEITTHADGGDVFELRILKDKVLVAIKSETAEGLGLEVYSENKFQFVPSKPVVLIPIADEEWLSAKAGIVSTRDPLVAGEKQNESEITFEGKPFRFSGKRICPSNRTLPSPDGRWLALQSADINERANELEPYVGTFHVDVLSILSGVKRFSVSAFINDDPERPASEVRWINKNYLFIDVFEYRQQFILCDATK